MLLGLAFAIGIIAGLRAMTAPAAIAWAAVMGKLGVDGTFLSFLSWRWMPWIFTVAAIGELITDQLPSTPSRKVPVQFGTRILSGALAGGAICAGSGQLWIGAAVGVVGAVVGTLGGAAARGKLAAAFGKDLPAALIEDVVAVGGAALIVMAL